jgi:hypothetical protein
MIVKFSLLCGLVQGRGPEIEILTNCITTDCFVANSPELTVCVDIDNQRENSIYFTHKNKTDHDTVVINGKIVEDKFFKIVSVWVDDILLPSSFCYGQATMIYPEGFLKNINYILDNPCKSDSLYFNGKIEYHIPINFFDWLYEYYKQQDLEYIQNHQDHEAEEKYLGYQQKSDAEQEIVQLLESNGYHITC